MSLSKKNENVAQFIAQHSNVCPVRIFLCFCSLFCFVLFSTCLFFFNFYSLSFVHIGTSNRSQWPLFPPSEEACDRQ